MGAIAAAVSKCERKAVNATVRMMLSLKHRGADFYGIGTSSGVATSDSLTSFETKMDSAYAAVGFNLSKILPKDKPQPVQRGNLVLAVDGRVYPSGTISDVQLALQRIGGNPTMGALSTFVRTTEGAYAIVALLENSLLVARDFLGLRPLYYADEKDVFAVASERKALWDLGAEKVKVFPPGVVAQVERSGACFSPAKRVETSTTRDIGLEEAACKLQELLRQSIIRETSDVDHVGIAFSGGLDSTVLAAVAKETGLEIELVTIGSAFDAELEHAKRAAETLELRQRIQIVEPTEVETLLKKVVWCVEEPTVLSVEVGMAMYIVSSLAVKEGFPVLMLGQGSDELFGGYSRFLEVYAAKGARAVKQAMYESLRDAYRVNFHRDEQVSASLGVELRLPFVHPAVVEFGLTIPLHLMIKSPEDRTRKWVLRRMAQDIGLPEFIVWRSKKAIQYSTGIDDALRKLAKRRGTRLRNLIYETFSKVFDIPIKHIFERVDHSSEAYVRQK